MKLVYDSKFLMNWVIYIYIDCPVVNDIVGRLPVSQMSPNHLEKYKALEKAKTRVSPEVAYNMLS